MKLELNGVEREIQWISGSQEITLQEVLTAFGYQDHFFAVALNRECVPRHQYAAKIIKEKDSIEVLSPMQGG